MDHNPISPVSLEEKTHRHMGRRPFEEGGTDQNNVSANQRMPRIALSHQTLEEARKDSFPYSLQGRHDAVDILIWDFFQN